MFGTLEKCSTAMPTGFLPFCGFCALERRFFGCLSVAVSSHHLGALWGITGLIFGLFVDIFGWKYLTVFPILRTLYGLIVEENNVLGVGAYCSNDP
jgi:hypothetical protein